VTGLYLAVKEKCSSVNQETECDTSLVAINAEMIAS